MKGCAAATGAANAEGTGPGVTVRAGHLAGQPVLAVGADRAASAPAATEGSCRARPVLRCRSGRQRRIRLAPRLQRRGSFDPGLLWNGSRTRDRSFMQRLLYPTELSNGVGDPGVEPGSSRRYPHITRINRFRRRGMSPAHGPGPGNDTGGASLCPNPAPVSVRLLRKMCGLNSDCGQPQFSRDPLGRREASHRCTSARMLRPAIRKSSKRVGT